jgi:hypothetical protein
MFAAATNRVQRLLASEEIHMSDNGHDFFIPIYYGEAETGAWAIVPGQDSSASISCSQVYNSGSFVQTLQDGTDLFALVWLVSLGFHQNDPG